MIIRVSVTAIVLVIIVVDCTVDNVTCVVDMGRGPYPTGVEYATTRLSFTALGRAKVDAAKSARIGKRVKVYIVSTEMYERQQQE